MAKKNKTKSRARKRFEKQRKEYRLTKGDNIRNLINDADVSASTEYAEQNYGIKISQAVIQTAQTLLDKTETIEGQKHVLTLACFAWNYSSFDDEKRERSLEQLAVSFKGKESDQMVKSYIEMVKFLAKQKQDMFPDIKCMVMTYDFVDQGNNEMDFNVATAPIE